jgi:hypothetical protein
LVALAVFDFDGVWDCGVLVSTLVGCGWCEGGGEAFGGVLVRDVVLVVVKDVVESGDIGVESELEWFQVNSKILGHPV